MEPIKLRAHADNYGILELRVAVENLAPIMM